MTYSGTRFSGLYFLVQAVVIVGWWTWLYLLPEHRLLFLPLGAAETDLLAFALSDLLAVVVSSLAATILFFTRSSGVIPAAWFSAGSMVYAALYCLSWAVLRDSGWLNVALMLPAALLASVAALDVSRGLVPIFRRARSTSARRHLGATSLQILLFWSFFLAVLPSLIVALEVRLQVPSFRQPTAQIVSVALFLGFSVLGLASGWTLAARGDGTPLPLDAPNRLVLSGPYAYVRNPMVVAGLGQGIAVALWLGSWTVLLYVLAGGTIWQVLVRPAEERDLETTFGESYRQYRQRVRCWVPRRLPREAPAADQDS